MTAGLPGVGIGGMFYLASALLMPLRSLNAMLSGRGAPTRWPLALRQAALAATMLGAVWATGWLIGWGMSMLAPAATPMGAEGAAAVEIRNAVRSAALLGSLGTLTLVLCGVQVLRMVLPPRPTDRNLPAAALGRAQAA